MMTPWLSCLLWVGTMSLACGCQSKKIEEPVPPQAPAPIAAPSSSSVTPLPSATETVGLAGRDSSTNGAPKPTLPEGSPHFAWHGPMSVHVDERTAQTGHRIRFSYNLDVCPGTKGTTLVTHRDLHVTELEGSKVSATNPSKDVRTVEAAASALPTMVIDSFGNFEHGAGYPEMLKRLAETFPGEDFSSLRQLIDNGQAASIVDSTLAQLWQSWVGAWLHFDPAHGASQEVILDKNIGSDASRPLLVFDGFTPDQKVRLHARLVPSRAELDQIAGATGATGSDSIQRAELLWNVVTEWPEIRPLSARSERRATVRAQGKESEVSESHEYAFAWPPPGAKPPTCP